jgi:drug/metabolite transporter (DMT)-like permease
VPLLLSSRAQQQLAIVGLVYCAAIWGSTFYVVRDLVATIEDPLLLVGYRFMLAALLLLPFAIASWLRLNRQPPAGITAVRRPGASLQHRSALAGLILGTILWLLYITQTAGLQHTTATNSGFITGLFIVFIPLLGYLLYRRAATPLALVAVGIAVAGLALLTGGLSEINVGDMLTLVSAFTYAWHVLLADDYSQQRFDPVLMCFAQTLVTGVLGLGAAWLLGSRFPPLSGAPLFQIVFLAVFPTVSAFVIQLWAQRIVPPLKVSLIFTLEPLFAALFAWTLGGEPFIALRAAGGGLILVAMVVAEVPAGIVARMLRRG